VSLQQVGAIVDEVLIYQAAPASDINPAHLQKIRDGEVDYITFTSSSTVNNFVNILGPQHIGDFNMRVRVACIGPITARTAQENGFTVDIIPDQYTIEALLDAIITDYKSYSGEELL
jgi:uroporphyrinogen III methyltransferase/synthase